MHSKLDEKFMLFVAINAIIQLFLDIIIEILKLVPLRINHLSLTFLNAFTAYKTLSAIKKDKFKFLHEDIQILSLMEILLILGDIFYLVYDGWSNNFFYVRIGFIVFSLINFIFSVYIMLKYNLYHLTYQGERNSKINIINEELDSKTMISLDINKD